MKIETNLPRLLEIDSSEDVEELQDIFKIISNKIRAVEVTSKVQTFAKGLLGKKNWADYRGELSNYVLIYISGNKPTEKQLEEMIWKLDIIIDLNNFFKYKT